MNHEGSFPAHTVERYVLGELSAEERDAFEDHFFSCSMCAEEVRDTSLFIEGARAVFLEEDKRSGQVARAKTSKRDWFGWLRPQVLVPAFSIMALAGVVIYQNAVLIPGLKAPRSLPAAILLDGVTRAVTPGILQGAPLNFGIGLDTPAPTERVFAELRSESGQAMNSGVVGSPLPDQGLFVYFPGTLKLGKYKLVVRSWDGARPGNILAVRAFEVVPQENKAK